MAVTLGMAGLAVSLCGPLLLLAAKSLGFNSLSLSGRLSLWLLALMAVVLAAHGFGSSWPFRLGLRGLRWLDLLGVAVTVLASIAGATGFQLLQRRLGIKNAEGAKLQQKVYQLSFPHRFFVVVTAAVVEEVLYRGYAIGIGQHVWGSLAVASTVSVIVFVVVHFSHGLIQLMTVAWIAVLVSLLFVVTSNLFACMLAHFIIDALGVLAMPWVASRQRAQRMSQAQDG